MTKKIIVFVNCEMEVYTEKEYKLARDEFINNNYYQFIQDFFELGDYELVDLFEEMNDNFKREKIRKDLESFIEDMTIQEFDDNFILNEIEVEI